MSKRKVVSLILLVLLAVLAAWFSTIKPEVQEAMMKVLLGM